MKISASKVLALGGLCALFAGAGNVAFAQGHDYQDGNDHQYRSGQSDRHHDQDQFNQHRNYSGGLHDNRYRQSDQYRHANQNERRRLDRLHAAYAQAAARGNYAAAERAHQHAQAIRARLHDQHRDDHHDTN